MASENGGQREVQDITIVGAGPTGLFAAFYAGLRGMKVKVIEALPEPGGQLRVLYPEKYIYDVPGFPKILALDLIKALVEQAYQFHPTLRFEERVVSLERREDGLIRLQTNQGEHLTRTALIAAGIGAFHPNRLDRPGVAEFEGRGVYYFVREKAAFRDQRVLIVGGGDSAVDWALILKDWAREVTLIHRRDQFRALEGSVAELMRSPVRVMLSHELKALHGDNRVRAATVFHNKTGDERTIPVDAVLLFLGFKADLGPVKRWGLAVDKRHVLVNGRMETNIPGVYAAGDIARNPDTVYLNLIAIGFAQAAIAVNCARAYLDPEARVFPGHSSEKRL
ncbi:MAG: NAD(P)/FAD-dependent oxidoreductase [Chloroflexi bacterium]|nr:NAD(P)/FAD-dependent oxidoreductase [Chloroflexota bacterium]